MTNQQKHPILHGLYTLCVIATVMLIAGGVLLSFIFIYVPGAWLLGYNHRYFRDRSQPLDRHPNEPEGFYPYLYAPHKARYRRFAPGVWLVVITTLLALISDSMLLTTAALAMLFLLAIPYWVEAFAPRTSAA